MYDPDLDEFSDILAARFSLGVADLSEIRTAELRIAQDSSFAERVGRYDLLFSALERTIETIAPTDGLWDRIAQAIDEVEKSPGTQTVRSADLSWEPFVPGIARKLLHIDKDAGAQISLYRVDPGTELGVHGHLLPEECLVLDGEIEVDGITARTGDLHIAFGSTRHNRVYSRTGALLYFRGDIQLQA